MDFQKLIDALKDFKVLYVEDDENVREETTQLLKLIFSHIDTAVNGAEGLEKYSKNSYDLVITDIAMPVMNGIEMIRKIKKINENQKFIIMTAYNDVNFLLESIELGVDGYIIKPIELNKFIKVIEKIANIINNEKLQKKFKEMLVCEIEKKTNEIFYKTYYDDLTKLQNRLSLKEKLKSIQDDVYLAIININNFYSINIVYGYEIGDKILKEVASFLKNYFNESELFYLGNDEYAILSKNLNLDDVKKLIKEISLKKIENLKIPITFTIGISKGNNENILKEAYIALKEAKSRMKDILFYSNDLEIEKFQKKIQKYLPILKSAIEKNLIIPYFQGIFNNETKKIEKYEVLARIKYKGQIVSPFYFIDVAEKSGYIKDITKIIIDKSFRKLKDKKIEISINFTEFDLKDDELIDYLIDKALYYDIDFGKIYIEILEGIGAIANNELIEKLKYLKKRGFKISIDDFGTMNSNFERVMDLNFDIIKIDGKFIKDIDKNNRSFIIAKAITNFAKSLGVKIIAEFVANENIQKIVENLEIDYSQGYLFSVPSEEI